MQLDISRLAAGADRPIAVFLDLDGTLIDIAATPDAVVVPDELPALLRKARDALDGALAIVTGRPLADVDRLLGPLDIAAAGMHGGELRYSGGTIERIAPRESIATLRQPILQAMMRVPGVLIEDKGESIAVHFHQVPDRAAEIHGLLLDAIAMRVDRFRLLSGKRMFEVLPRVFRKDLAVAALMAQAPFRRRTPVYIGDDRTDDDAIAEVVRQGGVGLHVGGGVADGSEFAEPRAVRDWLAKLPSLIEREILAAR